MAATNVGSIEFLARINTSQYKQDADEIEHANKDIEKSAEKSSNNSNKAFTSVSKVGLAAIVAGAVTAGIAIISNIDNAVKRIDTLNNSARTFENMGMSADSVERAMNALEKSILGLPTPLDEAVRGVQMIAGATNDVERSQKIFSAINNAIIGFGGSAYDVQGAVLQLSQAFSNGAIDAQTWNSLLQSNLGPALNAVARNMGITTDALKTGLSEGTISVQTFQDALITMNKEGGGGMKSFEQIAKDATSGISTGWSNMQTAITRGVANVIQAVGSQNISSGISNIGKAFETALGYVASFVNFVIRNKDFFAPVAVGLGTIVGLITAYTVALRIAAIAQGIFNAVMAANPIGLIILAIAGLVAALVYFFTQTEIGRKIFETAFNAIKDVVVGVFNWVKGNWPLLLGILTGPFGLAASLIIRNFNTIRSAVGSVWEWIKGVFSTIGSVASTIIKAPVNAIIGFAQNTINNFIKAINSAIGTINKIPGVSIDKVSTLNIPKLAAGGIVTSPTLAMVGEGSEPEAVIPLSKLDKILEGDRKSSIENHIGTIVIEDKQTADYFLQKLTRDQEIISNGMVPVTRYG